jgi:hypothetical protein
MTNRFWDSLVWRSSQGECTLGGIIRCSVRYYRYRGCEMAELTFPLCALTNPVKEEVNLGR